MLILIDESGDAGFKIARGSSPHFVVAMVIFRDLKEAEAASKAIAEARERLRVKPEFKFNKCAIPVRDGFFDAVRPFSFGVRALWWWTRPASTATTCTAAPTASMPTSCAC